MAVLADADRVAVWREFMQTLSSERDQLPGMTKADIRAAMDGIDDWVVANQTSFNTAIPQPARAALTASQKARMLLVVVARRWLTGV